MTASNSIVVDQYRRIDGFTFKNTDLTLSISYPLPIRFLQTNFIPNTANVGDTFSYHLKTDILTTLPVAIDPDVDTFTFGFRIPESFVVNPGWDVFLTQGRTTANVGIISKVDLGTISRGTQSVTVTVVRTGSVPDIFTRTGTTQISFQIPLMRNIPIVNTEPIIYDSFRTRNLLEANQELIVSYSGTGTKTFNLTLEYVYEILT
jgi:hypothetical protein